MSDFVVLISISLDCYRTLSNDNSPPSARIGLSERVTGVCRGSVSYVGDREGEFTSSVTRQDLPSFTRTDLQACLKCASWATLDQVITPEFVTTGLEKAESEANSYMS
jgi:hypothetical protein